MLPSYPGPKSEVHTNWLGFVVHADFRTCVFAATGLVGGDCHFES